ncbi:thioredoxin-like 2, isoform CRA_d [Rattus norvegicus]|uniref:Thioredoxin-like 2, isoform CRA_d n=1 Tax=Rattus norvegicus TaxID=10116 RepID=A6HX88_RAT|nr:thioredoxin-like 2, isoform CRA_d [Rattus norvegicus]
MCVYSDVCVYSICLCNLQSLSLIPLNPFLNTGPSCSN